MRTTWPLLLGLAALVACDVPGAPAWTADYLVPLNFPSIDLSGVPGGTIPPTGVQFQTAVTTQDVSGLVDEVLSNDALNTLKAELIAGTTLDITGTIEVSIATSQSGLFTSQALVATVPVVQGSDTTTVTVNVDQFRGAPTLYFQSRVDLSSGGGGTTVGPTDRITLKVNFLANVQVSK